MEQKKLQEILEFHKKWLNNEPDGVKADLRNSDLRNLNLRNANLGNADLEGADLGNADLYGSELFNADLFNVNLTYANLTYANLTYANLFRANLAYANLTYANLFRANLAYADLTYANLFRANLAYADLRGADLRNADLKDANLGTIKIDAITTAITCACPEEGSFVGYKKASNKIVVLEIPSDAKRSSATTLKCRCNKAKVLRIEELDGTLSDDKEVESDYDKTFIYKVGEIVSVNDFDGNRWNDCSHGIHFFISKELAKQY